MFHPLQGVISFVYFSALLALVRMGYLSFKQRGNGTTNSLFYISIAGFLFIGCSFIVIASSSQELMRAGLFLLIPAHWILGLTIAMFTLHFTGYYHRVSKKVIYLIYVIYLTPIVVTVTNPIHHLVISKYMIASEPFPYVYAVPNIGFGVTLGLGYTMIFAVAMTFVFAAISSSRITSRQFLTLAAIAGGATLIHFAEYVFYGPMFAAGPFGVSVVFIIGGFGYLVLYKDLLTLDPISRSDIVSSLAQPIIITDSSGCVIDYNTAAQMLFPSLENNINSQIKEVSTKFIQSVDRETGTRVYADEISATTPDGEYREYQVAARRITREGQFYGTTISLNDVTDLKLYAQDLEQQTNQLEDFTSFVSHDLRNPLATSQQFLDTVDGKDEQESQHIDTIDDALERMDTMIDNLLTLTREGQAIEERQSVDLADAIDYAWRISDTQNATLSADDILGITVYADESRLYTLFENLFRNAAEHGGPNTHIVVNACPSSGELYITDDGPGLPEHIDVFKKGATTSSAGTGLGLAIVERIIDAHGWSIEASNSTGSGGAKFTISGCKSLQKQQLEGPANAPAEHVNVP